MNREYQIKTELEERVPPKQFIPEGKHHYYIKIYIDASPSALDKIELVKYTLHPSFKDRYRVSIDRFKSFEIKIWSYGYFDIKASILMRDGKTVDIVGYVQWKVPKGMPFDDE